MTQVLQPRAGLQTGFFIVNSSRDMSFPSSGGDYLSHFQ